MMIEQIKTGYNQHRWVRIAAGLGLFVYGALLYGLGGGFPPWAWRFLFQVLVQLPHLWASQSSAIVLPLVGLMLLSLALVILWGTLLVTTFKITLHWWHEHEHFALDLQEAQRMAEQAAVEESQVPTAAGPLEVFPQPRPSRQPVPGAYRQNRQPSLQEPSFHEQPTRVFAQTQRQSEQQTYAVARASRVVGSSGLIRVPGAALTAEGPTLPLASRQAVGRSAVSASTQTVTRPSIATVGSSGIPTTPITPTTPTVSQPTQSMSRLVVEQGSSMRSSALSEPLHAITPQRGLLRIVPRSIDVPESDNYDTLPSIHDEPDVTERETIPASDDEQDIAVQETRPASDDELEQEIEVADTLTDADPLLPAEPLRFLVGMGLDPGLARKDAPNEDNLFAIQGMRPTAVGPEPVGLFIVADGMGGHAHGQEASQQAVHAISDCVVPSLTRPVDDEETFADLLKDGVHRANLGLYRRNRDQEHMMGTTLTAALLVADTAYIANVGDSRVYLYRPEQGLRQITRDHSIVARLVEDGVITRNDIYTHPKRNQIYRCLGEHATVEVDTFAVLLQADDVLILCSDGLWEMIRDEEIQRIIAATAPRPSHMSNQLIEAALANGGADNVSVIVVCMARMGS